VCNFINGKAFKPSDWSSTGVPIVRIQNLNDEAATFNYFEGDIEDKYWIDNDDLLFAWSGTPGTSFGAFIWNCGKAVLNQHIFRVEPASSIDKWFLMVCFEGVMSLRMQAHLSK
jgi:type I restriction enzyme S subunit